MPTPPNIVLFIGRLHPMLVHLPIGFLTLLTIIEILCRFKRFERLAEARGIVLYATVAATLITITCGLMLSTGGGYDPSLIFWHKWLGIAFGLGVIVCGVAFWKQMARVYNGALLAILLLLGPASHLGGSMSHGSNYLFAYAPLWMRPASSTPVQAVIAIAPPSAKQGDVYQDLVRPILVQNCINCHGSDRTSGNLRLDSYASILHGGSTGPAVAANDAAGSLLVQRISLPAADDNHMPPDGKRQPSSDQVELLKWWIDNGAKEHGSVRDLNPTDDQLARVNRLLNLPAPGATPAAPSGAAPAPGEALAAPGAAPPLPGEAPSAPGDAPAAPPISAVDVQSQLDAIGPKTGIIATPVAVDQPWVIINAQLNHSFSDVEMAQLTPLAPNIVDLNLAGTHITDDSLKTVGTMLNLKRLRLDRTSITDAGLLQLRKLAKLEYLNLYGTPLTNAALKTLANLPALKQVYLWKTKVDPSAAKAFAANKVDALKVDRLKEQIKELQRQINGAQVNVIVGVAPTTQAAGL